ncbi:AraC family transcriptional regulator [Lentzea sp. NPDC006480]|uniref:AraC family transcriptional regulator n=1 Tax=Lentzea sp. NPDC006480 TaxID=3157176 RepID=UPI0033AA7751
MLSPVLSAIHRAPGRDWQVDELAKLAALSRSAFATRFAEVLGQSPGAYVLRHRLEHAARLLLTTTEPVGRIAAGAGYSEAAFSRAFTHACGSSPRVWRASVRSRGEAPTSVRT